MRRLTLRRTPETEDGLTRVERNRRARERAREADVDRLDPTNPEMSAGLRQALRWSGRQGRQGTRTDFNPFRVFRS